MICAGLGCTLSGLGDDKINSANLSTPSSAYKCQNPTCEWKNLTLAEIEFNATESE